MHGSSSKHVNRMVRIKAPRSPQDYSSPDPTQTTAVAASSPTHSSVSVSLPISTTALAGIVTFLAVILILSVGFCLYRRHKSRSAKSPSTVDFDRNAFTEKKSIPLTLPVTTPIKMFEVKSPSYQSSISSHESEKSGAAWKPQSSPKLRITNDSEGTNKMPAVPKAVAEKRRPSRSKPWIKSLNLNLDEMAVGSPPPAYDIANSGGPQFAPVVPLPSGFPPEKVKMSPTPPTPPANRKSHASTSKKSKVQMLVVPKDNIPAPIASPARSESFAPKDLVPPPPVAGSSKAKTNDLVSANPFASREDSPSLSKTPRMMNVISYFTPTLTDELRVQVGDAVRVLEEYQDGWCFVQYVGKADAPKGVVPLVCLEERSRMVPVAHTRSPNGSFSSLNGSGWR